jgi:mono/diheme cytochrome c family protein
VNGSGTVGRAGVPMIAFILVLAGVLPAPPAASQEGGAELFRENCAACHSLGADPILGPGLAGVLERRERDWLIRKITEPDRMVAEGESITMALVEEHGMAMLNLGMTRGQAETILTHLVTAAAADDAARDVAEPDRRFSEAEVRLGRALFQGERRFQNRGVSCNACHDVASPNVVGGGNLAVTLGDAYERLGPAALEAMVQTPPFPVMRRAYRDRPVTDEEIHALLAFFQELDAGTAVEASAPYGTLLAGAGTLGTILLAGLFAVAWRGRRRGTVNREIFERQVKTR